MQGKLLEVNASKAHCPLTGKGEQRLRGRKK